MKRIATILTGVVLAAVLAGCGSPTNEQLLTQGQAQLQTGNIEQAKQTFGQVLSRQPHNPEALYLMGRAYHQQGLLMQAIYFYKTALELDPSNTNAARFKRLAEDQLKPSTPEPIPTPPPPPLPE